MNLDELVRPDLVGPLLVAATGDERWRDPSVALIARGKSNLTFELSSPAGAVILRRPPTGKLLPRAHDMGREVRVQRALASTAVPVANVLVAEAEAQTLDVPFYVMEKVSGIVPTESTVVEVAATQADQVAMVDALVDTLAALHTVDPVAVGLGDYGRPEGFVPRQVRTWTKQWTAAKTHDVAAVDELAARLTAHEWVEPARGGIVHGDYRLDNCLYDSGNPARINAVLDWELSTLGDPLADLGMLLFYWTEAGEPLPALTPAVTAVPGFPDRAHVIRRYQAVSGRDLGDLAAYVAFAHFKSAGIVQGIAARVASGQMAGQDFGNLDAEVERIADAGLAALKGLS